MTRTNTARSRSRRRWRRPGAVAVALAAVVGYFGGPAACGNGGGEDSGEDAGGLSCDFDDSTAPGEAMDLEVGAKREGFICPKRDEDWYAFTVDQSRAILRTSVKMKSELTNVEPTYVIHEATGSELGDVVARPSGTDSNRQVEADHCLDSGDYKMVVRDEGNDNADRRHAYEVEVTAEPNPDTDEPNDSREEAVDLQESEPKSGYIACQGDVDWYALDVPADKIFRVFLEADKPEYQPKVAIFRGEQEDPLSEVVNRASPRQATSLDRYVVAPQGGMHYIAVSDDDDADADASVPYEVRYELIDDADQNEPNNTPEEATEPQSSASCGGSWSTVVDTKGTIGSMGDDDWFKIPVGNCDSGILEARMEIQTTGLSTSEKWKTNEEVQAGLTMIRPDPKSACSEDSECEVLEARDCTENIDCSGFFESCSNQGKCSGAVECLPGDVCGGIQVQRNYECNDNFETCDSDSGEDPPANVAEFAAPIFSEDAVYLRAGDFQADGAAPKRIYSLEVRLREDPDDNEPNDFFVNSPENGASPQKHRERATRIPVYDCNAPTQMQAAAVESDAADVSNPSTMDSAVDTNGDGVADTSMDTGTTGMDAVSDTAPVDTGSMDTGSIDTGSVDTGAVDTGSMDSSGTDGMSAELPQGCCANKQWVEGQISYQNDRDWFEYQHPCPGDDCTIRVHYEVEGGPVDVAMNIYKDGGSGPWLSAYDIEHQQQQSPRTGTYGGFSASDRCAYAFQGHSAGGGDTYMYGLNVSDEIETAGRDGVTIPNPKTREWAPGQTYRICVEKISDECEEPPCTLYEDGCGPPQQ